MADPDEKVKTWRRPNVKALCFAALFNDLGADMLFAFYPLFVVLILGLKEMKYLGLIESVALVFTLALRPLWGIFSDWWGRRHFIWGGYSLLAFSRILQGLARQWFHLMPAKALYEVGRSMRNPPREALLSESVPPEERGFAFGLLNSMDTVGAVLGPAVGLGIFAVLKHAGLPDGLRFRMIFFIAALPTTASVLLVILRTREVPLPAKAGEGRDEHSPPPGGRKFTRPLVTFMVLSCLFSLWAPTENYMMVVAARIMELSRESMGGIYAVLALYLAVNVAFAPAALASGKISDKVGRKPPIVSGLVVLSAMSFGFAFTSSYAAMLAFFAMHGIYQGFLKPSQTALVADLCRPEHRGAVLGTYSMATGLASIPAALIFGTIWDLSDGWRLPFLLSGACVGVSGLLIALLVRPPKERR